MPTVTLTAIRSKIQTDLDLQDELFITDAELNTYINDSIRDVEAVLHTLYEDYFLTNTTVSLVSGTSTYSLPTDIYANKIRKILYDDGATKYTVDRIRDLSVIPNIATGDYYRYIIINSLANGFQLKFYPTPTITNSTYMTVWYLRKTRELSSDSDACDLPVSFINYVYSKTKLAVLLKEGNPMAEELMVETEKLKQEMINTLSNKVPDDDNKIVIDNEFYWDME